MINDYQRKSRRRKLKSETGDENVRERPFKNDCISAIAWLEYFLNWPSNIINGSN